MTHDVDFPQDFGATQHRTCAALVAPGPSSRHHASDTMPRPRSLGRLAHVPVASNRRLVMAGTSPRMTMVKCDRNLLWRQDKLAWAERHYLSINAEIAMRNLLAFIGAIAIVVAIAAAVYVFARLYYSATASASRKENSMRKTIAVSLSFALALAAGPAFASDEVDVMATVRQYIEAFNKGDAATATGYCAAQSSIIDDFPPYLWQGAAACADWSKGFDAYIKNNGITEPRVILLYATHIDITRDRAYVVVPANFGFTLKGKRYTQHGSILTVVLQKVGENWRITGWAWAKH